MALTRWRAASTLLVLAALGCSGGSPPRTPLRANGTECDGPDQCLSGHCDAGLCCASGSCCRVAADCPAGFRAASTCTDATPATSCQGTRLEATCADFVCGSTAVPDDTGCGGLVHGCGAYADVACTGDADQPPPTCAARCSGGTAAECSVGYTCEGSACVVIAGTGQACVGSGQGSCATGLKCESGVCCAASGPACCSGAAPCATGLACNAATAACGTTCAVNTGTGCADPAGQFCTDGAHCTARRELGQGCGDDRQCALGHCVDDVCCDSACTGQPCQRCDATSSNGAGRCGWNTQQTARAGECPTASSRCEGQCSVTVTSYACSGTGYHCGPSPSTTPVASGSVCAGTGVVPVSPTAFCAAGNDCADGACSAARWWTSCDGAGTCRAAGDRTDAYVEPVTAAAGHSLTSACGTTGSTPCSAASCNAATGVYTLPATCTGAGTCAPGATAPCEPYACGPGGCLAGCGGTDRDCFPGYHCVSGAGSVGTCESGALDAPCDVPFTAPSPPSRGEDCDPNLTCTSAKVCKLIAGQACTSSAQCGADAPHGTVYTLTCGAWSACPAGVAQCCD